MEVGTPELAPLAIIGFAFELPQDKTSERRFWELISEGRSTYTKFPSERLGIDAYYHPDPSRPGNIPVSGGHFIVGDLGAFDAPFFNITPGEASCMDVQQRHMLETAYHALEDAGIPIGKCAGTDTAVFTGCFSNDYAELLQADLEAEQRHAALGVSNAMLANRISWFFNFTGTSLNIDTACSSSLVALHLACQDLRAGNCSMALIGGANLIFHPNFMKVFTDGNFLGKDGRSWSFDQRANGYGRGDGHAVLVVKRMADAHRDGDTIRAVIRNSASNQDGRTPGILVPNADAQSRLIRHVFAQGNLDMEPTRFFEAHGTGTPIGDPIEANAIGNAFQGHRSANDPLYIGAVKANIGHLEGASGLAGVIKTILVLEKGIIPPIANLMDLNAKIDATRLNLIFPREVAAWPTAGLRRACVNSFGFGGTNAVVVLDDAYHYLQACGLKSFHRTSFSPPHVKEPMLLMPVANGIDCTHNDLDGNSYATQPILLVWSGADRDSLQTLSDIYRQRLQGRQDRSDWDIQDLAYTLAKRRSHLGWRSWAVVSESRDPRKLPLAVTFPPNSPAKALHENGPRVAFAFTGQGAQYLGMGRQLISFTPFVDSLATSERYLKVLGCPWSVMDIIGTHSVDESLSIESPEYSQPLTTCLQIALVDLLAACGIHPSAVIGHSSGEIAAAYACGALSHLSAIKVVYYRGILSARLLTATAAQGQSALGMTAVGISRRDIQPFLDRLGDSAMDVQVGCVNSPKSITLTGKVTQLSKLEQIIKADGIFVRRLRVPLAYHSRFMSEIADDYLAALGDVLEKREYGPVSAPMISSVTGNITDSNTLAQGSYWVRNLVSTVDFNSAFSKLASQGEDSRQQLGRQFPAADLKVTHVLEVGPHSALQGPIRECLQSSVLKARTALPLVYIPCLIRGRDSAITLLEAAGALYCAGFHLDLLRINGLSETPRAAPLDMPPYPFNHSESHWREPRFSKNIRFPKAPRHDLIGMQSVDWNPHIAQWRNVIRLGEVPWLIDHTLAGMVVVPAAAMVTMAIEAFKQLQSSPDSLVGLQIQDISFSHTMVFPLGQDSIEIQLNLITPPKSLGQFPVQFRLFLMESQDWIECCNGFIRGVMNVRDRNRILQPGPWLDEQGTSPAKWLYHIQKTCQSVEQDIYKDQDPNGLVWGPCFQNIHQARFDNMGRAIARVDLGSWKARSANGMPYPSYMVHPSTVDGLIQLLSPAIRMIKGDQVVPVMMPVRIQTLWVSCEVSEIPQGQLIAAGVFQLQGYRGAEGNVVALRGVSETPLLVIRSLEATFVGSDESRSLQLPPTAESFPLCYRLESQPDISIMSSEQLLAYSTCNRPRRADEAAVAYREQTIAVMAFIKEALEILDREEPINLKGHIKDHFIPWMQHQLQMVQRGKSLVNEQSLEYALSSSEFRQQLIQRVEESGPDGRLYMTLGRNLSSILSGGIDPLALVGQNWKLAGGSYEGSLIGSHDSHPACKFASLMSFKNPSLRILELGAGTGNTTSNLLQAMSSEVLMRWSTYDYTDISPACLSAARAKFQSYPGHITFAICDISKDPVTQSFIPGSYDLIIASQVLHLTIDIDQVLLNIKKLLKPGGKLLLIETTLPDVAIQTGFTFGLLEDWWTPLNQRRRLGSKANSPYLTTELWDMRLRISGFSGADVVIPGQNNIDATIISTAVHSEGSPGMTMTPALAQFEIRIVLDDTRHYQTIVAEFIQSECSKACISCTIHTIDRFPAEPASGSAISIFLLELDSIFLYGISSTNYKHLQSTLLNSYSVLWVTRSPVAGTGASEEPRHHLADGLGRVLMSENSTFKFSTLGLTEFDRDPQKVASVVSRLARCVVECPVQDLETSWVFSARDGVFHILRVTESSRMDTIIKNALSTRHSQQVQPAVNIVPPLSLVVNAPGQVDSSLNWYEVADHSHSLQEDEVRIRVCAVGLTRMDRMVAVGQLNETPEIGREIAGIVIAAGKECGSSIGDHVLTVLSSPCRSTMTLKGHTIIPMPSYMSFETAASLPESIWLAYHSLINVARVCPGETVLIFLESIAIGQMMVQVAKKLKAKVFIAAESCREKECQLLQEMLRLSENDFLPKDDDIFLGRLLERTKGRGANVVIGNLADENTSVDFFARGLGVCGRIVDISLQAGTWHQLGGYKGTATSNIMTTSVRMDKLLKDSPDIAYSTLRSAIEFASVEELTTPQPMRVTSDLNRAITDLRSNDVAGKHVIQLDLEHGFIANMVTRPKCPFDMNASYVIVGGFGGIGRGIVRWMVSSGARHLIILSRSGPRSESARGLMAELEKSGIRIMAPAVDTSDLDSLRRTMSELVEVMPPIRGCIQAAVAVRDNLWQNMTYDDWRISLDAKATASWNLHTILPLNLDFFILISSISSLFGNGGQSNYAAGNAFKDALAHYRIARGQKAVSINLGLMVDEGFVVEADGVEAILRRLQLMSELHMNEFLTLLEHYCDPSLPLLLDAQAQVVFGIELPSVVMAKLNSEDLHHSIYRPMFSHLFAMGRENGTAEDPFKTAVGPINREAILRATETEGKAGSLVTGWLQAKIAHLLGLTVEDIDTGRPIHTFGIDSLVAIDLKNWFNREIGAEVQVFMLLGNTTIEELANDAARRSRFVGASGVVNKP